MIYPTVESISSLASYAKNIHMFSESYLEAANTSYRTYSVALSGQHVVMRCKRLQINCHFAGSGIDPISNSISDLCSQTVATYEEALTGHGFNEENVVR